MRVRHAAHSARATATGSHPVDQRTAQRRVVGALAAAGVHDDAALEVEDRNDPHRPRHDALMVPVIGLDVGGANTKAAVVDGDMRVRIVSEPFEVWREPDALSGVIADVVGRLGLDGAPVAMTTTAELVDVFASKREGVLYVLDAARRALPGRRLRVMTTAGELVSLEQARAAPLECAAANWMATALLVARSLPDAILVDCGGTTTDVIPIAAGAVVAEGRTDLERLLARRAGLHRRAADQRRRGALARADRRPALPGVLGAVRDHRRRAPAAGQPETRAVHLHVPGRPRQLARRGSLAAGARRVRRPRAARRR